jgi:NAD(P)-dependent dehydrogenase (short-subunit alcohol dehydrogenase family)
LKRIALITGASRGIGKQIAVTFKNEGIEVIAPSRNELDLLSRDSVKRYINQLKKPIDILVNNAGINPLASFIELSEKDISETLETNLISPILLIQGILPGMIERKYGRIVNISSIWSFVSKPKRGIYSATKAGLNALTRTVAVESAKYNVLVNAVAPGFVNTELTKKNNSEEELKVIASLLPIQRLAEPDEIAQLVLFLCSEKNSFMIGQTIFIDGGYTCL